MGNDMRHTYSISLASYRACIGYAIKEVHTPYPAFRNRMLSRMKRSGRAMGRTHQTFASFLETKNIGPGPGVTFCDQLPVSFATMTFVTSSYNQQPAMHGGAVGNISRAQGRTAEKIVALAFCSNHHKPLRMS